MSEDLQKQLERTCFKYVWCAETDKIKRSVMYNDYENGGFKMANIQYFSMAQNVHSFG
jgi:hypothetical protein